MQLKKLILRNYKIHEEREIDLTGNIIGVIGPNGSGKSNLLGSMQFCLGGEQSGFTKSELLCWGKSQGHAELHLTHDGNDVAVKRSLTTASATFKYGADEYTGVTKVGNKIEELLGLDKELLRSIFVRQAEIDKVLFDDPSVRELAFQKLCGMGNAAKVHKKLGEMIGQLHTPPNYDEQIAEAKQRHQEMSARLKQLNQTWQACTQKLGGNQTSANLQGRLNMLNAITGVLDRYSVVLADQNAYTKKLQEYEASLKQLPIPEMPIKDVENKIKELGDLLTQAREYKRLLEAFERSGRALMALGEAPEVPESTVNEARVQELREKAQKLADAYNQTMGNVKFYRDLISTLGTMQEGMECPVCGGKITDPERLRKQIQQYEAKAQELSPQQANQEAEAAANKLSAERMAQQQVVTTYHTQKQSLMQQYKEAESALDAATRVTADIPALEEQIVTLETTRSQIFETQNKRSALMAQIESDKGHLTALAHEKSKLQERLAEMPDVAGKLVENPEAVKTDVNAQITQLQNSLREVQQLEQQMAQLKGMITELESNINAINNTIGKLEYKRSQLGNYQETMDTLNQVRDWFHYSNGPHTLATSVLSEMTADVNDFLTQFSAPFSVVQSNELLGFRCVFHDGRPVPSDGPPDARHLSGGQRIQLAIAFRLASYCMFANKLGILSLDEPTAHLDDYNVGAVCTLLEKVKTVAQQMGLQILIATHERAIIPFCDTLIDLGNNTETLDILNSETANV